MSSTKNSIRKLSKAEIEQLSSSNSGDLDQIYVDSSFDIKNSEIFGNRFYGKNILFSKVKLVNSIIEESTMADSSIISSRIINSKIGPGTLIEDSVITDTITSPIIITSKAYVVLIRNSQISSDVLFGGSDFSKTKSRGGSVFAFAHVGEGEFTKNLIIGSPPDESNSKTIVTIPHFGYYGKMIVLGVAVYNKGKKMHDIDSKAFFDDYEKAFKKLFFGEKNNVELEVGRANLGAGGNVSDYDPLTDKKSGVIFLLANSGIDVSFPPYLTVLYNSLIASSSHDIIKQCPDGVIPPNSLVISSRDSGALLNGYYEGEKKYVMNDRCEHELKFVVRFMKFLKMFANVAVSGKSRGSYFERYAWERSASMIYDYLVSVKKRWLVHYLDVLRDKSIPALEARINEESKEKLRKQLEIQKAAAKKSKDLILEADSIIKDVKITISSTSLGTPERAYPVTLTSEQKQFIRVKEIFA